MPGVVTVAGSPYAWTSGQASAGTLYPGYPFTTQPVAPSRIVKSALTSPSVYTPPTLTSTASSTWTDLVTTAEVTGTLTWNDGDRVIVVGITEDSGITLNTPTATGLTFSPMGSAQATGSSCWIHAWQATAVGAGSSAVTATLLAGTGLSMRGIQAFAWGNSTGFVRSNAATLNATQAFSVTRTQARSAMIFGSGDWSALGTGGLAWTPAGQTQRQAANTAQATMFLATWGDQGAAGSTTYGTTGLSGTKFTMTAIEVLGAPAAGGTTVSGTATGDLDFSAPASAIITRRGTATGDLGFSAPALGRVTRRGSGTTAIVFLAPASGTVHPPAVSGTATGDLGFQAPALGRVTRRASSVTALAFSAPALGRVTKRASSATTLTFQAPALGRVTHRATATGAFTFSTVTSAKRTVRASATLTVTFLAPASGVVQGQQQTVTGLATGLLGFSAPALGKRRVVGLAGASFPFGAPAQGRRTVLGSSATTISFSALASGKVRKRATATAVLVFSAPAEGAQPTLPKTSATVAAGNRQAVAIVFRANLATSTPAGPRSATAQAGTTSATVTLD